MKNTKVSIPQTNFFDNKAVRIVLEVISILILSVLVFVLSNLYTTFYGVSFYPESVTNISNKTCNNLNLFDTAKCLNEEVKNVYYNVSNVGYQLTEEQFKKEGGVCHSFADWYSYKARALGFQATTKIFNMGKIQHQIAIISSAQGYCIEDIENIVCYGSGEVIPINLNITLNP